MLPSLQLLSIVFMRFVDININRRQKERFAMEAQALLRAAVAWKGAVFVSLKRG